MEFETSRTQENLMRAFAGECQARTRYTFAAGAARKQGLEAVARLFEFTAAQELAHAKVFYRFLEPSSCRNLTISGNYPIDIYPDLLGHLRAAEHNERQEWEEDYAGFAREAEEEGFEVIGKAFEMIAGIEKTHAERFGRVARWMEEERLFAGEEKEAWMCLNCGQIIHATMAPAECYVCRHGQGFFVRLSMAPFV